MVESFESVETTPLLIPGAIFLAALLVGLAGEFLLMPWLRRLTTRSEWRVDDVALESVRGIALLWTLLVGIYLASQNLSEQDVRLLPSLLQQQINTVLVVAFIVSLIVVGMRLISQLGKLSGEAGDLPSVSILQNIIRGTVAIVGLLILLSYLGISITPALAALGVTGLAISLALQETLSSFFSGALLVISNQVRPGNYVKLSSGEEGYVSDISWRTTTIRQLMNNMVVVPNSVLTSAIFINHDDPEKEMSILINVGVSYDSDLEHVERVTLDVAGEVMREVEGGVPDAEPLIRYNTFGDFSIGFTVILRGRDFVSQYLIKHEFVKRLHRRYQQEHIVIPFPIRTLQFPEGYQPNGRLQPGEARSDKAVSAETVSGQTVSGQTVSGQTVSAETRSGER